ncbi:MAG TPA: hypothetical protein VFV99_21115 [Kofleriaceae bacterium]|nr:hypothetical protein [Kofleriaceae bacterium]
MATDDDAAAKLPPAPASEPKEAPERPRAVTSPGPDKSESEKINERLTERIRHGTIPPEPREPRDAREPRDPREDKLNETIRQRLEHLVPELVKKTFAAGMGAVFSTEEGIRKIAREVSLPDVVGYVASSADGAKDKVFEIVARETRDFLANLNLTEEIAKILTTLSFEIKTEIRFIPNSERITGAEPDVKASVKLKRNDKAMGSSSDNDDKSDKGSRLRFWRRDGESTDAANDDDESGGHDK